MNTKQLLFSVISEMP